MKALEVIEMSILAWYEQYWSSSMSIQTHLHVPAKLIAVIFEIHFLHLIFSLPQHMHNVLNAELPVDLLRAQSSAP